MQTAAIRYELGDHHSFEFVEGAIAHPMDPGIKSLVSEHDEFFCYLDETSASSCITALDDLETYMAAEGPFDAVMAFSQGASLAATLMIQKLWQDPIQQHINPLFKCAVFFSGGIPGDPVAIRRNEPRLLDHATDGEVIQVPTAHIWGSKDPQHLSFGLPLSQLCKNETRMVFTHEGGHEVPGSSSKDAVTGSVNAIRRTVAKAVSAQ
ncbi:hypothetical protein MMC22_002705 [Lobaria immixta]|nr:hypothetical protein [Lobaria immixta]